MKKFRYKVGTILLRDDNKEICIESRFIKDDDNFYKVNVLNYSTDKKSDVLSETYLKRKYKKLKLKELKSRLQLVIGD